MYNSCMKILLIASVLLLSVFQPAAAGQTLKEIMTQPADSADRENLRIWVPVERGSRCRLTVDILDCNNQVVRHLVDLLAGRGYHNFYWDKKDDSGFFVDSGTYTYLIDDCRKKKRGEIKASYSGVVINVVFFDERFSTEIKGESASLTIDDFNTGDSLTSAILDTTLKAGIHRIELKDIQLVLPEGWVRLIRINGEIVQKTKSRLKLQNE